MLIHNLLETYGLIEFLLNIPVLSYSEGITERKGSSINPQTKSANIGYQDKTFKMNDTFFNTLYLTLYRARSLHNNV